MGWPRGPGVVELPGGAVLRGRALRDGEPEGAAPEWGLYLLGARPDERSWRGRWVRWPDFWLPLDREDASAAFAEAYRLAAEGVRVEVACSGGVGRTGTGLACIAQLAGVPGSEAIAWVRRNYHPRAVETPWQRRYVRSFATTWLA